MRESAVNWQSGKFLPQSWRERIAFWIVARDSCFIESGTFDKQILVWREVQSSGLSLKEWMEMSMIWFLMYFLNASWQLMCFYNICPKREILRLASRNLGQSCLCLWWRWKLVEPRWQLDSGWKRKLMWKQSLGWVKSNNCFFVVGVLLQYLGFEGGCSLRKPHQYSFGLFENLGRGQPYFLIFSVWFVILNIQDFRKIF